MTQPQVLVNNIIFHLPSGKPIFNDLTLAFSQHKIGLVGRNGIGKSTLIKLILGEFLPSRGSIQVDGQLSSVPQNPILSHDQTVACFIECEEKLNALHRITEGSTDEKDFTVLNDEWNIEERVRKWLGTFGLSHIPYNREIMQLSGGEITRLFLVKTFLSQADFLILDEPTNHLDSTAREQLYQAIQQWQGGLIVVSHDRALLNLMEQIIELTTLGAKIYGGNYDDYVTQKAIEKSAHEQQLNDAKKFMEKTQYTIQSSREKHEKKQSYGKAQRQSGSIDKMAANSKKGRSERTQSKLLIKNERLINQAEIKLQSAREKIEFNEEIQIHLPKTTVPNGKVILEIENLNFSYDSNSKIIQNFSLKLQGPEKIALAGDNGSGKSTLVKLIMNQIQPQSGKIYLGTEYVKYLDQSTRLLNTHLSILDNFMELNPDAKENDAYRCLAQFLFRNVAALKKVKDLSGGEKLRALLACVLMSNHPPQLLILDEPTNHLDINSIQCIESVLRHYQGALIVISHDKQFLQHIGIQKIISAPFMELGFRS